MVIECRYHQVYREKIVDLKKKVAQEAVKQEVGRFIDVSTAQIYEAGKVTPP